MLITDNHKNQEKPGIKKQKQGYGKLGENAIVKNNRKCWKAKGE